MKIEDMDNLFTAHNKTENFNVFIVALDTIEAMEIARGYGFDAGLKNDWEIRRFEITDKADCDYILG